MNRELLKENRIHGKTTYPVSCYKMDCNEFILDCHWHDEMEFLMVTQGKAVFQVDSSHYEVHKGQAIFINCGELHAGYPLQNSCCSYEAVVFNPDFLFNNEFDIVRERFIMPIMERRLSLPVHIKGDTSREKDMLLLIAQISQLNMEQRYTYELVTKGKLLLLLSKALEDCTPAMDRTPCINNYKAERLKVVLNYIHENYREKISLPQLANTINMSCEHFCRYFKQMLRRSPIDYLNYYRIRKAAYLLESRSCKVSSIASEVGFDNTSYFVSLFKHYMKCTPSMYRKMTD